MKYFCKKILFFILIGILVLSLSLFALVGCEMGEGAASSPSNGNTTIDNGANATQSGDKGDVTAHQVDTNNPSEDTSNNENTHSTIGGGETSTTQPDNGNGGDTDLQNVPDEGNIGGTGNPENGTQSGTDNPNGNSGENNEGNGENGNTPNSGDENGDDIGNGSSTAENSTPDVPQPEELDFSGLEAKLVEIFCDKSYGSSVKSIVTMTLHEGNFLIIFDYELNSQNFISLYKINCSDEDFENQATLKKLCTRLTKKEFDGLMTFKKALSDITVDGVTYSNNGIEGGNPFARQCGVENAWKTYVSDIGKPVLNPNSSTNYFSGYQVLVVF